MVSNGDVATVVGVELGLLVAEGRLIKACRACTALALATAAAAPAVWLGSVVCVCAVVVCDALIVFIGVLVLHYQ